MKPIPVWLVVGSTGIPEDGSTWVVAAYDNREMAAQHAEKANEWLRQRGAESRKVRRRGRRVLEEECPYDPSLSRQHDYWYGSKYDVVPGVRLFSHLDQYLGLE